MPDVAAGPPPAYLTRHPRVGQWIGIDGDRIIIKPGKVELGQGVVTALAIIAAEELRVRPERVSVLPTATDTSPNEDYTSGSFSISQGGASIRAAAAALRSLLLARAEGVLGAPAADLEIVDGDVAHGGQHVSYWDGIDDEAFGLAISDIPARGAPAAKPPSLGRLDLAAKLTGAPAFIQDLDLPGTLFGRTVRPPAAPRRLERLDDRRARLTPGLVDVVRTGDFLGVVAETEEAAIRAAVALSQDCVWAASPHEPPTQDGAWMERAASPPEVVYERHDAAPRNSVKVISAVYRKPYIAHASIAPSCGLARWDAAGALEVWSHTQGVFPLRRELAGVFGMPESAVVVRHAENAGCYGHNGAEDAALDAAILSRAVGGRPVRVQWSRADEFGNEPYGPAMQVQIEAGVASDGAINSWRQEVWSNGHTARPGRGQGLSLLGAAELVQSDRLDDALDPPLPYGGSLRNAIPLYEAPDVTVIRRLLTQTPVRVSALRSLGAFANVFAIESMIDELALAAGQDPLAFRLRQLSDDRARQVLQAAAERVGWATREADGRALGLAFARYKNSGAYCAAVAEVSGDHPLGISSLVLAVDAGRVVSRDGLRNQIEGGAIQAASWTMKEMAPVYDGGRPSGWADYPILSFSEAPSVDVVVVDRPQAPSLGAGECAAGPVGAAIANAFAAAYGVRIRDLPITRERVLAAS